MANTLKDRLVKLSPEQLAAFLENEAMIDPELRERIERLADSGSPTKILDSILKEIKSIGRAHRFIDWRHLDDFARSLARVVNDIELLLLPKYPEEALKATDAFLKISPKVIERVDDSSGYIGDQFRYAVTVWGKIWGHLAEIDGKSLAKAIWGYFENNDYGLYDDIIFATGNTLTNSGLKELEALAKEKCKNEKENFSLFHALHDIAILRQSPEDFIVAFEFTHKTMSVADQLELAKLLLDVSRVDESIRLLESIATDYDKHKRLDLLIAAYEIKGEMTHAQHLRWDGFIEQHRKDLFKAYYDNLPTDQEKKKAIDRAIEIALTWDTLSSIDMLFETHQHGRAADVLLKRYDTLQGSQYYTLKDYAEEFTKAGFPLEAILIYRRLTEDILARAQSKYYHHAISYLKKSKQISSDVLDWKHFPSTASYFNELKEQHRRKPSFMKQFVLI